MLTYDPQSIEKKWQKRWEEEKTFETPSKTTVKKKYYILPQLPYPSASGLHVGHAEVYTACDIMARYQRMKGKDVMQVIGWDSFGLPAENYAIKTNVHPRRSTEDAIGNFREQIKSLGISVDWDREVGSHNPDYYKWTQWFFLLMYKRGLAYREKQSVNWCDDCKTVLANEQVEEGKCERCGHDVVQKDMEQWFLRITDYADRLLNDLDGLDWPEETKKRQKDWIGKSEGAELSFAVKGSEEKIDVFTTRPDTLFGATFMVLAPEHSLVETLKEKIENWKEVEKYVKKTAKKSELDRQIEQEKTGVELKGINAINPINGEEVPVWIADYVLASYGSGAIMAVPAHDERDYHFAKKFGLDIRPVYVPDTPKTKEQEQTIASYDNKTQEYFERTPAQVDGSWKVWFDDFFSSLNKDASIFEFGSGTGRDANYIDELGFSVTRSDVSQGFVDFNKEQGNDAVLFDLLSDTLAYNSYDVLLAYAVFLHFTTEQLEEVLKKVNLMLKDDGKLLFSVKDKNDKGTASEVSDEKIDAPRFFSYWTKEEIVAITERAGFEIEQIEKAEGTYWYQVTARKKADTFNTFSDGVVVSSDFLNGLKKDEAIEKTIAWLEEKEIGRRKTQYKLRDWSVSRQRFWGAPIPMLSKEVPQPKFVLDLHAWGSDPSSHYHPWLSEQLTEKAIHVAAPLLPNPDAPDYYAWLEAMEKAAEKNLDVVVARSMSCWTALALAQKRHLQKLVLVAPVHPSKEWFAGDWLQGSGGDIAKKFFRDGNIDFQKVRESVEDVVIYLSTNDPYIPLESAKKFFAEHLPEARQVIFEESGHFDADSGYVQFPRLFDEIMKTKLLRRIPEQDLPVLLPDDVDFKPTGESPLNYSKDFQEGVEEKYGEGWKREPDTLDTFMCSSWYFFRYLDPKNDEAFASEKQLKQWMPIDFYLGGAEHVNGHLLYSRFFTKVLYDAGYIDFDEPFTVNRHQGLILGEDNRKMSKRWGNVVNPSDVVNAWGADTCRMYEMFMGPLEDTKPWDTNGVKGVRRFLEKVWRLQEKVEKGGQQDAALLHKTIKKVTEDIDALKYNTAIAKFMELVNAWGKRDSIDEDEFKAFVLLLAPFAPHMAEELWESFGNKHMLSHEAWPTHDESLIVEESLTIAVQVNGKVRAQVEVAVDANEDEVKDAALAQENVQKWLDGNEPKKVIYVKGKLVSIVV